MKGEKNMINAVNSLEQTLEENQPISFDSYNFGGRCSSTNNTNFLITKTGVYKIEANINVAPTVAGQVELDVIANGDTIPGAKIYTLGTTVGTFESGSTSVIVPIIAGTRISVVNKTETNPVTIAANSSSIIIRRVA
jgi:phosphatidylserine decarboxylase